MDNKRLRIAKRNAALDVICALISILLIGGFFLMTFIKKIKICGIFGKNFSLIKRKKKLKKLDTIPKYVV